MIIFPSIQKIRRFHNSVSTASTIKQKTVKTYIAYRGYNYNFKNYWCLLFFEIKKLHQFSHFFHFFGVLGKIEYLIEYLE